MGVSGTSPCASCKLLRRRCAEDCIFFPHFPSDDPHKFALVHKVFGASNLAKMLQELAVDERGDAVSSLVYEASARVRDPVYGCVGAIAYLQNQVSQLQMQLAVARAEILCTRMQNQPIMMPINSQIVEPRDDQDRDHVPVHHKSSFLLQSHQHELSHQYLDFPSPTTSAIHDSSTVCWS